MITNNAAGHQKDEAEQKTLGIYIHIPFCAKKCDYCDFLSFERQDEWAHKSYVKSLIEEIKYRGNIYGGGFTVDTVFIGGGTPSLLDASLIGKILDAVRQGFHMAGDAEITVEANPKTLSAEKVCGYRDAGINRISIGAQSFDDKILAGIGRIHFAADISETFRMARDAGFANVNLDLMFAVPGHSAAKWQSTLKRAINLAPEHISFYGLQIEENTPLYDRFQNGMVKQVSEEVENDMYFFAIGALKQAGYGHYEISNAAKAGYECKHNLKYWSMEDYLGLGLGAHSFLHGRRFSNHTDIKAYTGAKPREMTAWSHQNSDEDTISEWMFTGLRKRKGIDTGAFEKRFQMPIEEIYSSEWPAIERYISDGYLIRDGKTLKLSVKGIRISNKVLSEFVLLRAITRRRR